MIKDFIGDVTYNSIPVDIISSFLDNLIDYLVEKEAYENCASLKKIKDKII